MRFAAFTQAGPVIDLSAVALLPPLSSPREIVCAGLNPSPDPPEALEALDLGPHDRHAAMAGKAERLLRLNDRTT
jgi:hypothetical protein